MAEPVDFSGAQLVWQSPEGMEDEVGELPAHYDPATGISTSCWALDADEAAAVAETGYVWLQVIGAHPPVRVLGLRPAGLEETTGKEDA